MQTIIESLRQIVGEPTFYDVANGTWDYSAMCEYFAGVILVVVVVSSVFRLLCKMVAR